MNGYRLSFSSPCINAGTNQAGQETEYDLDGFPRIVSGCVDMGAFEYDGDRYDSDGDGRPDTLEQQWSTSPLDGNAYPVRLVISGDPAEHGSPQPQGYGTNYFPVNSVLTNAVEPSIPLDTRSRMLCAGWEGAGTEPPSDAGNVATFTLTNDASIYWLWQLQHRLDIETNGSGQIIGTPGWINDGITTTVTAEANSYWHLNNWTGDVDGCTTDANDITAWMTKPRTLRAIFALTLAPHGTPQEWLAGHELTNENLDFSAAELDDFDKDGYPNEQEFIADTDPRDPLNFFPRLAPLLRPESPLGLLIEPTSTGRLYEVFWSPDLRTCPQSWLPYGTSHYGSGTGLVFDVTNQAPTGVFRSGVRLQ